MPKKTERHQELMRIHQYVQKRFSLQVPSQIISQINGLDKALFLYYLSIISNKYFFIRGKYRQNIPNFGADFTTDVTAAAFQPWLTETEFLQKFRMSRHCFNQLLSQIEGHPVFKKASTGRPQAPPAHQLMILLKFLGTEGTGGSAADLRNIFRIGRGTAHLYRNRALCAVLSLRKELIKWPDANERKYIASKIQSDFTFPNCVGVVDGTLFPLAMQPQTKDFADYSGRKFGFSMAAIIVSDHDRIIRYYLSGWPGSCHDNRVYNQTKLAKNPNNFFSEQEYIIGDSAFANSKHMVSSYKCLRGMTLGRDEEVFNNALSKVRISSEHTIGILKGRFPFLRSIRMRITENVNSSKAIIQMIDACVILHNFLTKKEISPLDWYEGEIAGVEEEYEELNMPVPDNGVKDTRRQQLTHYIREKYV